MRIPATLALVLLVLPAAAQPLRPALKQAQCPLGYMQSGGYCMPMTRMPTARIQQRKSPPQGVGPGVRLRE